MLKKKMLKGMNDQINAEMFSAYLYLSMENYFQSISRLTSLPLTRNFGSSNGPPRP